MIIAAIARKPWVWIVAGWAVCFVLPVEWWAAMLLGIATAIVWAAWQFRVTLNANRRRARAGLPPVFGPCDEPVRHRIHPDDLREMRDEH
jgi:hypothetical protein